MHNMHKTHKGTDSRYRYNKELKELKKKFFMVLTIDRMFAGMELLLLIFLSIG